MADVKASRPPRAKVVDIKLLADEYNKYLPDPAVYNFSGRQFKDGDPPAEKSGDSWGADEYIQS